MWESIDTRWQEVREVQRDRRAEGAWYRTRLRPSRRRAPESPVRADRHVRAAGDEAGTTERPGEPTTGEARAPRRAQPVAELV
ncbi:hypothetical protein C1701_16030 [Actinoalloteichus sp. AHMU CJ021]|uniref:Uncharacterized protein n=1 Tax=Actinoalloteichus caeruleus DSM 43889 TaxID=1120930 RepID=A0ABT1JMV6_ACTCY|nr:hypothetical protein [Actinoalloteichus caeruleus]AUS79606.1 hypothetical protein C1701_16030 [Actinoalloteichus sp. AHMU CJ021]MCP2333863.1 hypothetical protein [Actinoalloteichus caeruleus DSM 43889]